MGLKRATRNRWIAGVCAGLAYRFGWRPNMVRLVLVLVLLLPGFNVPPLVAYALAAYFLPESEAY